MGMLDGLLGGLIDKEQITRDTIQSALQDIANELSPVSEDEDSEFTDFFIMIRPVDKDFNHKYYICKYDDNGNPKMVREIPLKEVLKSE